MGTIGIPVKLIHEAVGHIITVELKGGASYRGTIYDGTLRCFDIALLYTDPFTLSQPKTTSTWR